MSIRTISTIAAFTATVAAALGTTIAFASERPADVPGKDNQPTAWADVPVVTMQQAAKQRLLSVEGLKPRSYRAVTLEITNRTNRRMAVDLAGSHVIPRHRNSAQRLGIGPPVTPITPSSGLEREPGMVVVELEPREEMFIDVNTCCLDAGLPAPSKQHFRAGVKPIAPVRQKVLRWWAANPSAPQSAVNSAIWRFDDEVRVAPGVVEHYKRPTGTWPALFGGSYYRLRRGELMATDPGDTLRVLGTEVFDVLPSADGVFSIQLGEDRKPDLMRLAQTGRFQWDFVLDLDTSSRIQQVVPVGGGKIALVTDKGILVHDRAAGTTTSALTTSQFSQVSVVRAAKRGHLRVTLRRPPRVSTHRDTAGDIEAGPVFELWDVDLTTVKAERVKSYWNVRSMLAGGAGVFGLTHAGKLRRLNKSRFQTIADDAEYDRLIAAAGTTLWARSETGMLVAIDATSGRRRFETAIPANDSLAFDVDPETGDLGYFKGDEFHRVRAADGKDSVVVETYDTE